MHLYIYLVQVWVWWDEHHQVEPEDRRHRGRDLQGEVEDQKVCGWSWRDLWWYAHQLLNRFKYNSNTIGIFSRKNIHECLEVDNYYKNGNDGERNTIDDTIKLSQKKDIKR